MDGHTRHASVAGSYLSIKKEREAQRLPARSVGCQNVNAPAFTSSGGNSYSIWRSWRRK